MPPSIPDGRADSPGASAQAGEGVHGGASEDTCEGVSRQLGEPLVLGGTHVAPRRKKVGGGAAPLRFACIVLVVVALCGGGYLAWQQWDLQRAAVLQEQAPVPQMPGDTLGEEASLPDNPVDFGTLQAENPEVVGWLCVSGTNVNLAVMQSATDDSFYLTHAQDGSYSAAGAVYMELANDAGFGDPVTVLYGHNMASGAMFAQLHNFEDEAFFEENDLLCVYTPGHVLSYKIIAAFIYDNRHILNSFDFSDAEVLQAFFDSLCAPDSLSANVREGVVLDAASDKVIVLSTCNGGSLSATTRYLVAGVLESDQLTN